MAITVVDPASPPKQSERTTATLHNRRISSGQIVASQAALVAWLAAYGQRPPVVAAAGLGAAAVLAAAWVRLRGRWGYQWLAAALGHLSRRRVIGAQAHPAALLDWVRPGARVVADVCDGEPAGVVEEIHARTALLELGRHDTLLSDAVACLPPLPDLCAPGIRLHLVVSAVAPQAGPGAPATSYRQLTEHLLAAQSRAPHQQAPVLARQRVVLAVQALRGEGTDPEEVAGTLAGAVRRVRRRLGATVGVRLLTEPAVHAVLADLAHHDGAHPVRESWTGVRVGGLVQATYRLPRWPSGPDGPPFIARLLALPAAATTVGVTVGPGRRASLAVRLAAANPAGLAVVAQALRRVLDGHAVPAWPCDGAQAPSLAATLPIGGDHSGHHERAEVAAPPQPPIGGDGLVLGLDRRGAAVTVRVFRPEPTTLLLVGGVSAAQLLALRALALGAQVVVRSGRPGVWEPFVRAVSAPGHLVAVVPAGQPTFGASGTALRPHLVVDDATPSTGVPPVQPAPWQTVLTVREELTPADIDPLTRADLVVAQPLNPAEAALATQALGLGDLGEWLGRIRGDMVGVVHRRSVRWAVLATTQIEQQLFGTVRRG
jgi:type VII secretion protein EccE